MSRIPPKRASDHGVTFGSSVPARPEIAAAARLIIEGNYIAIYEPADYGIEIVIVVHAMREPSSWLD